MNDGSRSFRARVARILRRRLRALVGYVTLEPMFESLAMLTDERRAGLRRDASEALQKRDAAELLTSRGSHAEALALAVQAAGLQRGALESAGAEDRVSRALEDMKWALSRLEPAPVVDAAVTRAHVRALGVLLAAELSVAVPLREALLDRRGLQRLRWHRGFVAALVASTPVVAALFVRWSVFGMSVFASGALSDQYAVDRVLDGDPETAWVAGAGDEWIEFRFLPRRVHHVRILNGNTLPDRAAKDVHVDLFSGTALKKSLGMQVLEQERSPKWSTFDAGGKGVRCNRIVVNITAHYGAGASVAEVQID